MTWLDQLEELAAEVAKTHPGPWRVIMARRDAVDRIVAAPVPVDAEAAFGDDRDLPTVCETDGGHYEPRGALAKFIATCDPGAVTILVRIVKAVADVLREDGECVQDDAPNLAPLYAAIAALRERS